MSKEGKEKLQKMMKEKKERGAGEKSAPVRCYSCGQEGHISPQCPKKMKVAMTVVAEENVSTVENSMNGESMMKQATAGMSNEQLKLFASYLMNEAEKNKH